MRKTLLVAVTAFAWLGSACSKTDPKSSAEAESQRRAEAALVSLTVDDVDAQLAAHEIVPVDCNVDAMRKKLGVVPGAILISDDESFAPSELPADKSTKLVFYCHNES